MEICTIKACIDVCSAYLFVAVYLPMRAKHYKFMLDLSFISKGKEKNGAEKYLPLIFADEYAKHTLSDAPLVSVPRKKLKQLQP